VGGADGHHLAGLQQQAGLQIARCVVHLARNHQVQAPGAQILEHRA